MGGVHRCGAMQLSWSNTSARAVQAWEKQVPTHRCTRRHKPQAQHRCARAQQQRRRRRRTLGTRTSMAATVLPSSFSRM